MKEAKKIVNFRRFVYCVHLAVLPARKQFFLLNNINTVANNEERSSVS